MSTQGSRVWGLKFQILEVFFLLYGAMGWHSSPHETMIDAWYASLIRALEFFIQRKRIQESCALMNKLQFVNCGLCCSASV